MHAHNGGLLLILNVCVETVVSITSHTVTLCVADVNYYSVVVH